MLFDKVITVSYVYTSTSNKDSIKSHKPVQCANFFSYLCLIC